MVVNCALARLSNDAHNVLVTSPEFIYYHPIVREVRTESVTTSSYVGTASYFVVTNIRHYNIVDANDVIHLTHLSTYTYGALTRRIQRARDFMVGEGVCKNNTTFVHIILTLCVCLAVAAQTISITDYIKPHPPANFFFLHLFYTNFHPYYNIYLL